jgi:hypothetical protein
MSKYTTKHIEEFADYLYVNSPDENFYEAIVIFGRLNRAKTLELIIKKAKLNIPPDYRKEFIANLTQMKNEIIEEVNKLA